MPDAAEHVAASAAVGSGHACNVTCVLAVRRGCIAPAMHPLVAALSVPAVLPHAITAGQIQPVSRSHPLTSARSIAPDAFRRWVIGGTLFAVTGYLAVTALNLYVAGAFDAETRRTALLTVITTIGLLISARWNPVVGGALTLTATWLEVESHFLVETSFPGAGIVLLPTLVLGFGLLLGSRVALGVAIATVVTTIVLHRLSPSMQLTGFTTVSLVWFLLFTVSVMSAWALMAFGLRGFTRVFTDMMASRQDLADTTRFAPDGILVVNSENRVLMVNPAAEALIGLRAAQIVDRLITDVLSDVGMSSDQLVRLADPASMNVVELQLSPRNVQGTTPEHVEATWYAMEGGRRQLLLHNVSQRVRAEEQRRAMELQLAHSQRLDAVGRLAGGLSHDFNNILTAVSGSAEMLRTETDPVERGELLDEIIAARDRGAALTRQLLSFARREVTQPRVIDIGEHARGLTRLLQRVAGDRQRLRFELAPDCRALVDPGQLEQALVNLVANARDAMPDGGWCEIACERVTNAAGDARVLLHVSDEGSGMTPETAERAFEPFFTTKARGQGTGLGLASVHGMAQQSNGSARIDSAPGRGTRVTIELPAVSEAATAPPDATAAPAHHSGPYSILVAEDDIGTRRIVERILRHAGYDVRTAVDGVEALAVLEAGEGPFDLLLSDVMMPGCTGPELSDRARVMRPGLPVLLMTGYAEEHLGELMSSRTARDVITKPFSGTELTNRIAELLRTTSPV